MMMMIVVFVWVVSPLIILSSFHFRLIIIVVVRKFIFQPFTSSQGISIYIELSLYETLLVVL